MTPLEREAYEAHQFFYNRRAGLTDRRAADPLTVTLPDMEVRMIERHRYLRVAINALAAWGIIVTFVIILGALQPT